MWYKRSTLLAAITILVAVVLTPVAVLAVETRVGLLAVGERGGIVVTAGISIDRGDCSIVVEPAGLVASDTSASSRLAVLYASILAGIDPCQLSARISFYASERVSGPSASGFIAYTVYSLLTNKTPPPGLAMTGALSATGVILPVEGVEEKVRAAANLGYRTVYVPLGEKPGDTPSGVAVVEVCSLPLIVSPNSTPITGLASLRWEWASVFRETAEKLIDALESVNGNATLLAAARDLYRMGHYYSAASVAFTGLASSLASRSTKGYNESLEAIVLEKLGYTSIEELRRDARRAVENVNPYRPGGYVDLWSLDALAQAYARLVEAENSYSSPSPSQKYYGLLRYFSVLGWAELAREAHGPLVREQVLASRLSLVSRYLREAAMLYSSLFHGTPPEMPDGTPFYKWLRDADRSLGEGELVEAYARYARLFSILESSLLGVLPAKAGDRALQCLNRTLVFYWTLCPQCATPSSLLYSGYAADSRSVFDEYTASSLYGSALATGFVGLIVSEPLTGSVVVEAPRAADEGWIMVSVVAILVAAAPLAALGYSLARSYE